MFGYVRPYHPALLVCQEEFYRGVYCGLCRAQKKRLGDLASLTLSYDAVFLALVRLAVTGEKFTVNRRRCVMHPLHKRAMLSRCAALDYSAMVTTMLAYHNLRDDLSDERGAKKLRAAAMLPLMQTFRARCRELSPLDESITKRLAVLSSLEKAGCTVPDEAADAFGYVLADAACYGLEGKQAALASDIGMHLGRWIYLIDAAEDHKKDLKSGAYNPFIRAGTSESELRERVLPALECERLRVASTLALIEYPEGGQGDAPQALIRAVLENISGPGMKYGAERVFITESVTEERSK